MCAAEGHEGTTEDPGKALAKLEELDRVLPRSLEDWVAARERDGLHVPDILKKRLAEKERLRAVIRKAPS